MNMVIHQAEGNNNNRDFLLQSSQANANPIHPRDKLVVIFKEDAMVETFGGAVKIVCGSSLHSFFQQDIKDRI